LKRNNFTLIFFVIFSLLFISCSQNSAVEYTTGQEVYEARCSACHGRDFGGRVGPAIDATSNAAIMPESYWIQTITKGKGSMPAQRLTDNEVSLVIEYIQSNY
jgi:mono/diheme cytochrome c family protein